MATVNGSHEPYSQVGQVISRLRTYEDYNLAIRLQEEEYNRHFEGNRDQRQQVRRQVGSDRKHSRNQQHLEDEFANQLRRQLNSEMTKDDEAVARRLQEEFEREEQLRKESQARCDEELARHLQEDAERQDTLQREAQTRADEHLARRLQVVDEGHHHRRSASCENYDASQQASHTNHAAPAQKNHDPATTEDDERFARELQKQFDDEEQQRAKRRARRDDYQKSLFKSLLPITGRRSQSNHSSRDQAQGHSVIRRWQDSVDAHTENEVNLQMAGAIKAPSRSDNPPPYAVAMQAEGEGSSRSQRTPGYRPLAVIATRESRNEPSIRNQIQNQDRRHLNGSSGFVADRLSIHRGPVRVLPFPLPVGHQPKGNNVSSGNSIVTTTIHLGEEHSELEPNVGAQTQNQGIRHVNVPASSVHLSGRPMRVLPDPLPGGRQPAQNSGFSGIDSPAMHPRVGQSDINQDLDAGESGRTTGIIHSEPDLITFDDTPPLVTSVPQTNAFRNEASTSGIVPTALPSR